MQERLPSKPPLKHNIDDSLPRSRWIAWGRIHPAAFGILMMAWLLSGTAEAVTDTFTASGNWTAPAGVTSVTVEAWGGGGAGGGATGNPAKGGGGAGGQYASKTVTVIPGNSYTITVGSGGTASTGNGNPGGDSIFGADAVVAKGGAAGGGAASNGGDGTAGAGSTSAGIGDVVYAGGNGAAGSAGSACNTSGAGGGGAGSTGAGGNATGNTGGTGTATGGGSGGNASNSSGNGGAGSVAGGAGSGACAESNTDRSGGSGARGQVWVSYALPPTVTTGAATSLSVTEATLNGTVTSNGASTTVTFDYGLTTAYGSSAAAAQSPLVAGASGTAVSAAVTGLACNTTYHFRAKGVNSAGTTNGNDLTFTTSACPTVTSIDTAGANPTNAASVSWTVIFSSSVTGVSSSNFTLVNSGLGGTPAITGVSGSGTSWTVTASTGTGTGTLGLNMINATGISPTVTTSTFTGQVYTIDRTAPVVSSIVLVDSTPTSLSSVSWTTTFSENVTGVNAADFALAQASGVSGASVTSVTGSGTTWTVTANSGTGNGTLGLNLVDDDTIVDTASNPLGGTGAGNGNFTGEIYTVVRPSSPTACIDDSSNGTVTWGTPSNAASSNNVYATASVDDNQTTHYLKCTGYGFSLPTDAVIEGVTVGVERYASSSNVRDAAIRIVKNNSIGTSDKSSASTYPTTDSNAYVNYGGAADLWGETWTPADINSANFGVAIASKKSNTTGGARTVSMDHLVVSVAYRLAVNCTSNGSGNWSLAATWINCRGGIPLAGDSVTIASTHNVTLNVNTPSLASLTVNSGGTLTNTGSNTITLTSDMNNAGTYSGGSGAVSVAGNFTNTGTFTSGSGTWTFSGTSAQSITGVTSFNNLTINNANGVTLNSNVTVTTALTLTNGSVSTGSNTIGVTANCPGGVSRTSGFVDGNLRLKFPTGTTTCTYDVGSGTTYAPISLTLTASASGTALTGSTTGNEHPSIAMSGVDATKDVNRYWSLWQTGDTATAVTSFNATFTFVSGDVDIGAATGSFIVGKYNGSSWSLPTIGTRTSTTTSISNVSGAITANLGFVAGEAGVVDAPCTSPEGMTCVCDNFARSNLNPSTIFGANWVVGHSSGTFGDPVIVSNSLRMTNASTNVATVATLPGQFPAAGNKITVEFQHYAYGSTAYTTTSPCSASSPCGADGIALTLSDSTITPVAGAYGGSLGYAQKTGINGFSGGWIGVGIDEWGNFANPTEGRVGGIGFRPESVTLRGSGSGSSASSTNYPYLVSSGSLSSPGVDNALSATRSWGHSYRITVDASDYTWNGSTGVKAARVKVERDIGSGYATLPNLDLPDIYTYNTGQANVPENWKLSFTAGTGDATNIHEIRGLKICSTSYTPPSGFNILVDNLSPTTCTSATNGKPVITISARDSYGNLITSYTNTVTLNAKVSSPSGSNSSTAVWSKVSGSANGTLSGNQYTFAAADSGVAQFYLTDTNAEDIYITVGENGGTLSTTLSTPVQFRGTAFTVTIPDTLGDGVVAGRNHLMRITRSSGCGVDTTYTGAKSLDGWYAIATGTHPSGAYAPQFCLTNAGGTCLPDTGLCETLSIAAPTLNASSNYLPALTFTSGVANFCLKTTDVGNYSVNLRDDSNVSVPIVGSSATLAVRPFAIVASNVSQGAISNPATGDATGTPMVAGTAFQTMIAGYLWNSAGDIANNGLPSSSAGYSALTAAGTLHSYADTVVLSASTPFAPKTPSDTPAGTGVAGSLTNGSVAFTSGIATLSNLSYNEVGSFTLKA